MVEAFGNNAKLVGARHCPWRDPLYLRLVKTAFKSISTNDQGMRALGQGFLKSIGESGIFESSPNLFKMKLANFLMIIFCCSFIINLHAQATMPDKLQKQIYHAFISGDIERWEATIHQLAKEAPYPAMNYDLAVLSYGVIGLCLGAENTELAKKHLIKAEEHLKVYMKNHPNSAQGHALQSGILGYKIAFSPMSGMWNGARSNKSLAKAMELDDTQPKVWYLKGISLYHTPSTFGGDQKASIEHFAKAVSLYYEHKCTDQNWEYLEAFTWLGKAYAATGQPEMAKHVFEEILEIAPNYGWVKYALLPQLKAQ